MKKFFKRFLFLILVLVLLAVAYLLVYFPPIMTGMDAKTMCSCVFVTGRTPESVLEKELQVFPGLDLADININEKDSSVTARLLWRESKAIFRNGLGCTLLAQASEQEIRNQQISRPNLEVPDSIDSLPWPAGNSLEASVIAGVNYNALNAAIDEAFTDTDPEKPVNTHGIVVVYDGKIVAEKYAPGFTSNSRLMGWSMTKSITNALVGVMVKDGKLNINDPAPIAEWQNDERKQITINNLLQASTGLGWEEGYFNPTSDFHNMFIRSDDKAGFAASRKSEKKPGTFFEYSSGSTNILSRIIREKLGDDEYYRFPYEKLFHRIGMYHAIIEPDASGTFVASSYGYASARDWARLGLLYLNDGVWNGERIFPEGWVKYSTTPGPAATRGEYGAQIWLNAGRKDNSSDVKYPGLPNEAFVFDGFEENSVVVIPSRKAVVVRLGVTHHGNFDLARFVNGVLGALPEATDDGAPVLTSAP